MAQIKLQADGLNLADTFAFTGTITGAGGGKIGQVIAASASPDGVQIDSPSSYVQLTDGSTALVASITPSATSSNVFVMCNIQSTFNDEEGYGVSLRRAGVEFFASATTQDIWCQSWDGSRSTRNAWFAIDTGISTTSATEYSVYVKTYADSATYFQYLDNPSQLILMEILA